MFLYIRKGLWSWNSKSRVRGCTMFLMLSLFMTVKPYWGSASLWYTNRVPSISIFSQSPFFSLYSYRATCAEVASIDKM